MNVPAVGNDGGRCGGDRIVTQTDDTAIFFFYQFCTFFFFFNVWCGQFLEVSQELWPQPGNCLCVTN